MADSLTTAGRRVKVYLLNENGRWDDRGTGRVRIEDTPAGSVMKVTSDQTGNTSLVSRLRSTAEAFYQIQEDNIISWTEETVTNAAGVPMELALSFAEAEGCRELWERICALEAAKEKRATEYTVNGGVPLVDHAADGAHARFLEEGIEGAAAWGTDAIDDVIFPDTSNVLFLGNQAAQIVPAAETANFVMPNADRAGIEMLSRLMADQNIFHMPAIRERITAEIANGAYVTKLCQIFRKCESEMDLEGLSFLYHVVKCLFLVGNNSALDVLVNQKHLMDIVGCLEYDPEQMPDLEKRLAEMKSDTRIQLDKADGVGESNAHLDAKKQSSGNTSEDQQTSDREKQDEREPQRQAPTRDNTEGKSEDLVQKQGEQGDEEKMDVDSPRRDVTEASQNENPLQNVDAATEQDPKVPDEEATEASNAAQKKERLPHHAPSAHRETKHGENSESATPVTATTRETNTGNVQKNNSEETTSSGNMGCDSENSSLTIRKHRDFLQRKVAYKSVVPITDSNVVSKIHQNFRVAYIRDFILTRAFEDVVNNSLSGVIVCNNVDIIMYFISGNTTLHELFDRMSAAVQFRRKLREGSFTSLERKGREGPEDAASSAQQQQGKRNVTFQNPADESARGENRSEPKSSEDNTNRNKSVGRDDVDSSSATNSPSSTRHTDLTVTGGSISKDDPTSTVAKHLSTHDAASEERRMHDSATVDPESAEQCEAVHRDLHSMLSFLRELTNLVKGQQPALKTRFHALILELGFLEVSVGLLLDPDFSLRCMCCDILTAAVEHDQNEVRAHVLKNATQQDSSGPRQELQSVGGGVDGNSAATESVQTNVGATGVTAECEIAEKTEQESATMQDVGAKASLEDGRNSDKQPQKKAVSVANGQLEPSSENLPAPAEARAVTPNVQTSSTGPEANASPGKQEARHEDTSQPSAAPTTQSQPLVAPNPVVDRNTSTNNQEAEEQHIAQLECAAHEEDSQKQARSRIETDFPLIGAMIEVICRDTESGVVLTVLDLLRQLLDPTNMRQNHKEPFISIFYRHFAATLLWPFTRRDADSPHEVERVSDENICHLCDLLSFCVHKHEFHSKYFVIGRNVAGRMIGLLQHPKAFVKLASLRFVRACVCMRDSLYDRYLVKHKVLQPVFEMFDKLKNRDNLLGSAVMALVQELTTAHREILLRYVIEDLGEVSMKWCEVRVFQEARHMYQELKSRGGKEVDDGPMLLPHPPGMRLNTAQGNLRMVSGMAQEVRPAEEEGIFSRFVKEDEHVARVQAIDEEDARKQIWKKVTQRSVVTGLRSKAVIRSVEREGNEHEGKRLSLSKESVRSGAIVEGDGGDSFQEESSDVVGERKRDRRIEACTTTSTEKVEGSPPKRRRTERDGEVV